MGILVMSCSSHELSTKHLDSLPASKKKCNSSCSRIFISGMAANDDGDEDDDVDANVQQQKNIESMGRFHITSHVLWLQMFSY